MIASALFLLSLASEADFVFAGGTPQEFVRAIHERTGMNVFMMPWEAKIGPFTVKWAEREDRMEDVSAFAKAVANKTGFRVEVNDAIVFSPVTLPWYRLPAQSPTRTLEKEFPQIKDALVVDKGDVEVKGLDSGYFWATYLPFHEFTRHTSAHKFLDESPCVASSGRWKESEYLAALATGIGGRVVETEGVATIAVDLEHFRSQYVALLQAQLTAASTEHLRAKKEFEVEAVKSAPVSILQNFVDLENHLLEYEIPSSSRCEALAQAYTKVVLQLARDESSSLSKSYREHLKLVEQLGNFRRPLRVSISTNGTVNLCVMIGDEKGGISY